MNIIDNINTLLGNELKQVLTPNSKLKIAASCFSIYAYEALRKELSNIDSFEFIFTSPTFTTDKATDKLDKQKREFYIPKLGREKSLYGTDFEIKLRNQLTQKAIARECAEWIKKKAVFKSNNTSGTMSSLIIAMPKSDDNDRNAKTTVFTQHTGFTTVDLGYERGNDLFNIKHKLDDPEATKIYLQTFDRLWQDKQSLQDVTQAIYQYIETVYQENSAEFIYFIILYNIFHEFLDDLNDDVLPNDKTGYKDTQIWQKLYNFQKDAATGIINRLELYNGCILADSVGLGKTFTALAVIKYYELRNKSILVLCPKKLVDNWMDYRGNVKGNLFLKDRFSYDVLCHTDINRASGQSCGMSLNKVNWGNYDLVVIDESHNFRNNYAVRDRQTRYQILMEKVIKAGVKTKVLMLSATPVNNKFTDLRNQLALAYEGESQNLNKHLKTNKSIDQIFNQTQQAFNSWAKLPPEERTTEAILDALDFDFFKLLDSVTIARSRKHITKYYDTSDIGDFPKRRAPISIHCKLTARTDVMGLNEIFEQLQLLKLSVYSPMQFILPSRLPAYEELLDTTVKGGSRLRQSDRETALVSLMTTNLLKRLESSVYSFKETLVSLVENHQKHLKLIEEYQKNQVNSLIGNNQAIARSIIDEDEESGIGDIEIGSLGSVKLSDMDTLSWQAAIQNDLQIIQGLLNSTEKISPEDDEKLQNLKVHIQNKVRSPINPGNRKIIIFTAFADTANYLYEQICPLASSLGLHTARIIGSGSPQSTLKTTGSSYTTQEILTLFSPQSKSRKAVMPDEPREIDLLIATDCISEGQNLQDCDYLINYDIHWNPVRIIQRFGRIDRIGSKNKCIQLVNYWPDITLDEYIKLKDRVHNRMTIADVSATGDDNVLTARENDLAFRKAQLERLQQETIDLEETKSGVSITDLGLNEFRMDLLSLMKTYGEPDHIPNGMHAVVEANSDIGLMPGSIFVLKNINQEVAQNLHNRLHPYYLVYISNEGQLITNYSDTKKTFDLIRCSCKGQKEPLEDICKIFNKSTADGRKMDKFSILLTDAIKNMLQAKEEKDIDSLFTVGPTTALEKTFSGLDDFELISFIVVVEREGALASSKPNQL